MRNRILAAVAAALVALTAHAYAPAPAPKPEEKPKTDPPGVPLEAKLDLGGKMPEQYGVGRRAVSNRGFDPALIRTRPAGVPRRGTCQTPTAG
jgi:hypothetical protein